MQLEWLIPISFAVWKLFAYYTVTRIHRDDPDDKVIFIPQKGDYTNPLVGKVGGLRKMGRATRRRWIALGIMSLIPLFGFWPTWPVGIAAFVVVYTAMKIGT